MNPYVEPNTRVNFNRLGITDSRVLQVAEYQAAAIRIEQLDLAPIAGEFGLEHWRAVHKDIFQDVYDWGGKERTLNLSKVDPVETWWKSRFAPHDRIARSPLVSGALRLLRLKSKSAKRSGSPVCRRGCKSDPAVLSFRTAATTRKAATSEEAVLMEVEASTRLFGGKRALRDRIVQEGADQGVTALGWATNSLAAH